MKQRSTLSIVLLVTTPLFAMESAQQVALNNERNQLLEAAKTLVESKCDINDAYKPYYEPLILVTAKKGADKATLFLLEHGARPNPEKALASGAFSPLHHAIRWGNLKVIKALLAAGANVNECNNSWRDTPLMHAVQWARVNRLTPGTRFTIVTTLLEAGALPTLKNDLNQTAGSIAEFNYPDLAYIINTYDNPRECRIKQLTQEIEHNDSESLNVTADHLSLVSKLVIEKLNLCKGSGLHLYEVDTLRDQALSLLRRLALITSDDTKRDALYTQIDQLESK